MADTKITALAAIGANPINVATFPIPMVDLLDNSMAASGTTKKVTVNQILGAGGTATLASATITGAATVGTTLGVTGVSTFAAGTALLPALTTTGDVNTGIYYPAADTFAVTTGGTERYRVDSSGNLGVGATSGSGLGKLYSYQDQDDPAGRFTNVNATQTATTLQILSARNTTNDTFRALSYYNTGAAAFKFYVIDSGAIYSTSTSITGISDISLKENVKDLETGLSQILALKPRRFDWKDGSASNVQGFIAQEVEGILPDLVTNYRYNDTESKKALRLGDMIPTLVKAIQELTARVEALEA